MDRSSSTKQTHYVFEINSQANQDKSKIENDKTGKLRNLAVKKETVMIDSKSHEFIIFYESKPFSAKKLFYNPFVKVKKENDTKEVKKNFINLLLNKNIDKGKIKIIEQSLFDPVSVPRPFNKSEKTTRNNLNNISGEISKLSNDLTKAKLAKVEKEEILVELNKFQKVLNEKKLASDEVKNLLIKLNDENLSDAELISLLKPISVSNEKRKIEAELKNLDSNSGKLSDKEFSILNDKLAGLNQELDILKNAKDIKFFEDKLKDLENLPDEKSTALIIKLKNTINNLKTEPRILEISKKLKSINKNSETYKLLITKNLLEKNLIGEEISEEESKISKNLGLNELLESTIEKENLSAEIKNLDKKLENLGAQEKSSNKSLSVLMSDTYHLLIESTTLTKKLNTLESSIKNKLSDTELNALFSELGTKSIQKNNSLITDFIIKSDGEKITSLIYKLETQIVALKKEIPNLESQLAPKLISKSELENFFHKNDKASKDEGIKINLTDVNLFYENIIKNAEKFDIAIRENTSQSKDAKAPVNAETELISIDTDPDDLSDKENIASLKEMSPKVNDKTQPLTQSWRTTSGRSPRTANNILIGKQLKTPIISSDSKTLTDTNDLPNEENIASLSGDETKPTSRTRSPGKTIKPQLADNLLARKQPELPDVFKTADITKNSSTNPNSAESISFNSSAALGDGSNGIPTNGLKNDSNTNKITANSQRSATTPLSARNLAGNPLPIPNAPLKPKN